MLCLKNILKLASVKNLHPYISNQTRTISSSVCLRFSRGSALNSDEFVEDDDLYVPQERPPLPMITSRQLEFPNPYVESKQAWLENLDTVQSQKLGIIDLHPDIFGRHPRLDLLHSNTKWQYLYKYINYECRQSRAERPGGGRKPFKQKRTGKHRAGSIRAPQNKGGGAAMGPRGPLSKFYMLADSDRVHGLCIALSVKYAQRDLHIVDSLQIPSDEPDYLLDLLDTRYWGFSALFVDDRDIMPQNIALAASDIKHVNLMPVYGLNVYSMLKHDTLVLTLKAVEKLEAKLLERLHSPVVNVPFKA
ncbi:large ribosomal subunit protein uL4m-like [Ruditapes philippinarum]|jgi:large subunit ribosomal protein L4|uniref:large ribosomal subunit protein uL4m-like n=1 Tax=Ruditapes philippinarum TaxID=129788 RepID=UPI00295A958D|nr:large ribosomal subunit protein uL4m-like [Ruditapes philippinarum]